MNDSRIWLFHALYVVIGGAFVLFPSPIPMGWRLFVAGISYNIALPLFAVRNVEPKWIRIWGFLLPLSLMQIFPDWYLAEALGTLEFPDLQFPKIGPVSAFMGLLWITPLFLIVEAGEDLAERVGKRAATLWCAALSILIFGVAEATLTLIPVWYPVGVKTLGPVAFYVLIPEAILGASAWWAFRITDSRSILLRLGAAAAVVLLYIATLSLSFALIEGG